MQTRTYLKLFDKPASVCVKSIYCLSRTKLLLRNLVIMSNAQPKKEVSEAKALFLRHTVYLWASDNPL